MSPTNRSRFLRRAALALTAGAVGTQVAHPLLRGEALRRTTIASVTTFCAATLTDTAHRSGAAAALRTLALAGGAGLLAEVIGTRTGRPFGRYRYAGTLGPSIATVPVVVPLAWTMMAGPAVQLGRTLGRGFAGPAGAVLTVGTAAWTLASWDLFLDPQMTAAGHWAFAAPHPHLPGLPGIPLSNYAGWALTAAVICAGLHAVLPRREPPPTAADEGSPGPAGQLVPAVLLGWTWWGSALGNAVFFRRPAAAAWGGVAMGLTVAPYLRIVRGRR